jgi:anti-sigma-K factor RskA
MSESSDRDLLAAEYVLGTLEADEAESAASLLATDAAFAAAVHHWEQQLAPLAAGVSPVAPRPQLWDRIEATTAPSASGPSATIASPRSATAPSITGPSATAQSVTGPSATAQSVTGPSATAPSTPATPHTVTPDATTAVVSLALRRRLRVWQASTGVALAVAASLAAFIVLRSAPTTGVAVLAPTTGGVPVLLATAEPNGVLNIRPEGAIAVPSDRDLELWALEAGQTRARSLGVLPAGGRRLVAALTPGTTLMVSLEPRGGSPTGQATGPVLYGGRLAAE